MHSAAYTVVQCLSVRLSHSRMLSKSVVNIVSNYFYRRGPPNGPHYARPKEVTPDVLLA